LSIHFAGLDFAATASGSAIDSRKKARLNPRRENFIFRLAFVAKGEQKADVA
jgi:hypothetical protein